MQRKTKRIKEMNKDTLLGDTSGESVFFCRPKTVNAGKE